MTADVRGYLSLHTGLISDFPGKDFEDIKASFSASVVIEENETDKEEAQTTPTIYEFAPNLFNEEHNHTHGHCVAVSVDGYFLTAHHVIDGKNSVLVFDEYDEIEDIWQPRLVPYRIVYENEEIDFAVIKAEVMTPLYLTLHAEPPEKNETLFGGGFINGGPAAGKMLANLAFKENTVSEKLKASRLISDLPITKGDSGSALIDSDGHLHGVFAHLYVDMVVCCQSINSIPVLFI